MIINTSESLTADELLTAIDFEKSSSGRFVCVMDDKQLFVPTEINLTQLCTVDAKSSVHVSCSAYHSQAILPNFSSTKIVSVELDHIDLRQRKLGSEPNFQYQSYRILELEWMTIHLRKLG